MQNLNYSIQSILNQYNLNNKATKKGNDYLINCPFHKEKTPSFSYNTVDNVYNCFGCGKKGNSFTFIKEYNHYGNDKDVFTELAKLGLHNNDSYKNTINVSLNNTVVHNYTFATITLQKIFNKLVSLTEPTEYLKSRSIDKIQGNLLYIANDNINIDGISIPKSAMVVLIFDSINSNNIISMQYITAEVKKFIPNHTAKAGCLPCIVDKKDKDIILVESVIDALSLNLINKNAIACFSLGNIQEVVVNNFKNLVGNTRLFSDLPKKDTSTEHNATSLISSMLTTQPIYSNNDNLKDANDVLKSGGIKLLKQVVDSSLKQDIAYIENVIKNAIANDNLKIYISNDYYAGNKLCYMISYKNSVLNYYKSSKDLLDNFLLTKSCLYQLSFCKNKDVELAFNNLIKLGYIKQVKKPTFKPNLPYLAIDKDNNFNVFKPTELMQSKKPKSLEFPNILRVLQHITNNDSEGLAWLYKFLAIKIQEPSYKLDNAILFTSTQGAGKGVFSKIINGLFSKYTVLNASLDSFNNKFNGMYANTLMVFVDEVEGYTKAELNKFYKQVKSFTGADTLNIEGKGKEVIKGYPNLANPIILSNQQAVLNISKDDRRFTIFNINSAISTEYTAFLDDSNLLDSEVLAFYHFLKQYKVKIAKLEPYINKDRKEAIEFNKHPLISFVDDVVDDLDVLDNTIQQLNYKHNIQLNQLSNSEVVSNGIYAVRKINNELYISSKLFSLIAGELDKSLLNKDVRVISNVFKDCKGISFTNKTKINGKTYNAIRIVIKDKQQQDDDDLDNDLTEVKNFVYDDVPF